MSSVQTEFTTKESTLARTMGIPRGALRTARAKLLEGTDWKLIQNTVLYSENGMKRLERVLTGQSMSPGAEKKGMAAKEPSKPLVEPPATPEEKKGVVTALTRNRQILMAEIDGETCRVRVRSSENFVAGMQLTVQHIDEDLYEFTGRCPRSRGRW